MAIILAKHLHKTHGKKQQNETNLNSGKYIYSETYLQQS
jgi:hypothetical protein